MIEANPRASRTVPFVSKAIGVPLAKMACRLMLGEKLADLGLPAEDAPRPRLGQGGGPAVRPLRGLRRRARPGDALDRRGHGRRPRLPDRVRQGAGRGRRVAAQRGHGLHHGDRRRQARRAWRSRRCCTTSASGSSPRAGPRRRSSAWASRRSRPQQDQRGLAATSSTGSRAARSTSWSTRRRAPARAPTAGRSAAPRSRAAIPCLTTLSAGLARRGRSQRRRGAPRSPAESTRRARSRRQATAVPPQQLSCAARGGRRPAEARARPDLAGGLRARPAAAGRRARAPARHAGRCGALRRVPGSGGAAAPAPGRRVTPRCACGPGLELPGPVGLAAGFDKDARGRRRAGRARLRLRRGRHGHRAGAARQPAAAAVPPARRPRARQPHGLQQRRRGGRRRAPRPAPPRAAATSSSA